jgi:small subunit ribosomal protein S9
MTMAEEQANVQTEAPAPQPPAVRAPQAAHRTAPPLPVGVLYIWGTGRRKKAVARVRIRPGTGKVLVNKREVDHFFTEIKDRQAVSAPLEAVSMVGSWDIWAKVDGGGRSGQAGAVMLGLARAIAKAMPDLETALRDRGLLTRDARMKERKKYGQKGARKRFQYSKR